MRVADDEYWFSLSDSDISMYLQGVNADKKFNVEIDEIDTCPVQIQGPKAIALMQELIGDQVDMSSMPFYGLAEVKVGGRSCVFHNQDFLGNQATKFIFVMLLYMQKICGMLCLR